MALGPAPSPIYSSAESPHIPGGTNLVPIAAAAAQQPETMHANTSYWQQRAAWMGEVAENKPETPLMELIVSDCLAAVDAQRLDCTCGYCRWTRGYAAGLLALEAPYPGKP